MDRGAWRATVNRVAKSKTRLKQLSRSAQYIHYLEGNQGILSLPALNSSESESEVLSCVQLFAAPWAVAHQAPPSMEFSRQEYWNGLPFPTPGDLPDPGIKPMSLAFSALAGRFFTKTNHVNHGNPT